MARGRWGRIGVLVLAVLGVVALSQATSTAAFVATTDDTADTVSAGSWCVSPTTQTVTATADTYYRSSAADQGTNYGTETTVAVRSGDGDWRAYVSFPMPTVPSGCTLRTATLRLYLTATDGTRTVLVNRGAGSWTETGLTYTNRATAGTAGTAVSGTTGAVGWQSWTVTTLTQQIYSAGNYGFRLVDSDETNPSTGGIAQRYSSREGTHPPELVLTWS